MSGPGFARSGPATHVVTARRASLPRGGSMRGPGPAPHAPCWRGARFRLELAP
jgi:hypothetical protein